MIYIHILNFEHFKKYIQDFRIQKIILTIQKVVENIEEEEKEIIIFF